LGLNCLCESFGIDTKVLEYRRPTSNLHLIRVNIFCIEDLSEFDSFRSVFENYLYLSTRIEKIFFHLTHGIDESSHRLDDIVLSSEIKLKTPIFCRKGIRKDTTNFWFFTKSFWAVPIRRSKTPVDNMFRFPEDLPYSGEGSLDSGWDCEFWHMYK